jgi:hypothetical protein
MWEPQPLTTLRASTAGTVKTLPYQLIQIYTGTLLRSGLLCPATELFMAV